MFNTAKIQTDGNDNIISYKVNDSMDVPAVDGNKDYEELKILMQGYRDTTVANGFDENGEVIWVTTRETFEPLVPEPEFTQEELNQQAKDQAKLNRDIAVAGITVTTTAGNTFDGDERSQSRMERSITSLTSGFNGTTKNWKLADNSIVVVDANELKEALTLASLAQDVIWLQ